MLNPTADDALASRTGRASGGSSQGPAKLAAGVLSAVLVGAVAWPINENFQKRPQDDFPFSYYPMFTYQRGASMSVNHLVGITADGREVQVNYRRAGEGGFNQTRRQINRYVREDNAHALLDRVGERLADSTRPEEIEIEEIQVVRSRFRFDEYFSGNKAPSKREVVASAPIERSPQQEEARQRARGAQANARVQTQGDSVVQGKVTGGGQ